MPKTTVVRIKRIKLGGEERLDIRRFRRNGAGELIPTHRGLSLPPDKVGEIIRAMEDCGEEEIDVEL